MTDTGSTLRRIVLVEDEPALRDNYTLALSKAGFDVHGFSAASKALASVKQQLPDVAIIDIGLGRDSEAGFELCRALREVSAQLPILFLSARDSELDVISGLRLGADDYLTKDISLAQMMARILALFRRMDAMNQPEAKEQEIVRGPLRLNLDRMLVGWKEQTVDLTVTELWMVHALAKQPGHVKNRQQLMDAANVVLDDNTITSHIKRIRKKFAQLDEGFDAIQTAYGMGYRWVED